MTSQSQRRIGTSSRARTVMRWSLHAFLVLGAIGLLVVPTNVAPTTAQEESSGSEVTAVVDGRDVLPMIGEIDFRDPDGTLLGNAPLRVGVDPELHLAVGKSTNVLYLVDTRSLEQVGAVELPFSFGDSQILDVIHHRVIASKYRSPGPDTSGSPRLAVVDLEDGGSPVVRDLDLNPTTDDATGSFVRGPLAYDAARDRLYLVSEQVAPGNPNPTVTLHAFDMSALLSAEPPPNRVAPLWSLPLDSCGKVATARGGLVEYTPGGDFIAVGCEGVPGVQIGHAILRIDLAGADDSADTSEIDVHVIPFAGNMADGFAVGNAAQGLAFVSTTAAGDQKLFVADLLRKAWTGALNLLTDNTAATVADPSTGRIYQFDSDRGLLQVSEGNRVSVPNGTTYDVGLASATSTNKRPLFDPRTRRLFFIAPRRCLDEQPRTEVEFCSNAEPDDEVAHWGVLEDRLPAAPPPERADWDARTEDLDPAADTTSTQYAGNAQGFGAAYTFVGGTRGARLVSPPSGAHDEAVVAALEALPLGAGPRHLYLGRADYAAMSGSSFFGAQTSAKSAGFVAGNQTKNDYSQTGGQWPDDTPEQFRAHPSACSDFGSSPEEQSESGSAVVCDSPEQLAQAAGRYTQPDASSPFQVGSTEISTAVTTDEDLGIVSTARAAARDVTVGVPVDGAFTPLIRIGEVVTDAKAVAHGQPGTAATTLTREIRQVAIGPPGEEGYQCGFGDGSCDPYQVVEQINERTFPRMRAYIPAQDTTLDDDADFRSPDDAVSNGTAGGAKATVQKDPYLARNDEIMHAIGDPEVPGLIIEVYDDHDEPSRHVLHLAGVALDANFFLSEQPTLSPWPGPGGGTGTGGTGGVGGGLPGGLPGTSVGGAGIRTVTPPLPMSLGLAEDEQPPDQSSPSTGTSDPAGPGTDGPADANVAQGQPPSLSTVSQPGDGSDAATGAPAPEVAPPDGETDGQAAASGAADRTGPAGLVLTRQRLSESAPLAALWLLGAVPFYLAIRRRNLTRTWHRR